MKAKAKETEKAREIENQAIVDMQESMSRENSGIESLAKMRKESRFKYYLTTLLSLILEVLGSAITLGNRVTYLYHPSRQTHFFLFVWAKKLHETCENCDKVKVSTPYIYIIFIHITYM